MYNNMMRYTTVVRLFIIMLIGPSSSSIRCGLRLMQWARNKNYHRIAKFVSKHIQKNGVYISHNARLSSSIKMPHPIGIVIGEGVVIGDNSIIFQNVTIGGARIGDWKAGNYPSIGKNVTVFAGAVIVGKINVGDNCVIGANSVVRSDIPPNSTCVGAPARVIEKA